jgi:hypothetical protein
MSKIIQKAHVEPGHFLPTCDRHVTFLMRIGSPEQEIRFVTSDGKEYQPVSTYEHEGIVFVDLEPIRYENAAA